MRTRATPLEAPPERRPYVRVTTSQGPVVLRMPSPLAAARLLEQLEQRHLVALLMLADGPDLASVAVAAQQAGGDLLCVIGAVVGAAWADPLVEIEAGAPWGPDGLAEYGEVVLEELHEAGYVLADAFGVFAVVALDLLNNSRMHGRAAEVADFLAALGDFARGRNSKPA